MISFPAFGNMLNKFENLIENKNDCVYDLNINGLFYNEQSLLSIVSQIIFIIFELPATVKDYLVSLHSKPPVTAKIIISR